MRGRLGFWREKGREISGEGGWKREEENGTVGCLREREEYKIDPVRTQCIYLFVKGQN